MEPKPFSIQIEQTELDQLRLRLARTRWATVTGRGGWEFGTDPAFLHELIRYWHDDYDWRAQEASLNALPQFKMRLDSAELHFQHLRGDGSRPFPLLLLHGWPDSFYRFHKVLPLLTGAAPSDGPNLGSWDLVVPSLPGFALTGPVPFRSREQPMRQSAELLWRLMTEGLGYSRFGVAGGDTGGAIAQILALDHPQSVVGIHLTDLGWHASNVDPRAVTKEAQKYLEEGKKRFMKDGAYVALQTTRPQSLAAGLNDSPVGLASWILDRFHSWSDCGDYLERSFSKDELLTNIMLYWLTGTIGSSTYNYYIEAQSPSLKPNARVEAPVALALFPKDIGGVPPRSLAERTLNVQRWTEAPRGGHFAALEVPELYARDVGEFFGSLGSPR